MSDDSTTPAEAPDQVRLDPALTEAAAIAALAAYADLDGKKIVPPPGFKLAARFTGWDEILVTGEEERFGLFFRSSDEEGTYFVAFRGTDSILDAYEDIWATTAAFKPFKPSSGFPKDVEVACGFNSIYVDTGGEMKASMQGQVFDLLESLDPKPKKLLITGHSLGCALASLFTLDVAVSRPDLTVINTNFASPRVGQDKWYETYDKTCKLEAATFRIANYWDWVPALPPNAILDYKHVGQQFLVAFYVKDAWVPYLLSRHSMLNYQTVVGHAVALDPQVWAGAFKDAVDPKWTMVSESPPSCDMPLWLDVMRKAETSVMSIMES